MKTLYLDQITTDSGRVVSFFQVLSADKREKKDGSGYLSMRLGDRTGQVDAKCWFVPQCEVKAGDWVKVDADANKYKDALQLRVSQIRIATEADGVDKSDFIPCSKRDRRAMLQELADIIMTHITPDKHPGLQDALRSLVSENANQLHDAPAARKLHQGYLGGLLEHGLNLIRLAKGVAAVYPEIDRELLIAACIIHDIGKLEELAYDTHIAYTRTGALSGHIIQGVLLWSKYSGSLDSVTRDHLQHIIASHHGQRDWGAAVLPMTLEAQVFHLLDMIDSRVQIVLDGLTQPLNGDGFAPFHPQLGVALWQPQSQ